MIYYVCISHNRICSIIVLDFTNKSLQRAKFARSLFLGRALVSSLAPSQIANTYLRDPREGSASKSHE